MCLCGNGGGFTPEGMIWKLVPMTDEDRKARREMFAELARGLLRPATRTPPPGWVKREPERSRAGKTLPRKRGA